MIWNSEKSGEIAAAFDNPGMLVSGVPARRAFYSLSEDACAEYSRAPASFIYLSSTHLYFLQVGPSSVC